MSIELDMTGWKPDENLRRIVCAANWYHSYEDDCLSIFLVLGPRHWDDVMRQQYEDQKHVIPYNLWEQGFIDNFGKLHNRKNALVIARRMNQIIREVGGGETELYSEMLY